MTSRPGKTYPQGYDGPDLFNHDYVDILPLIGSQLPTREFPVGNPWDAG